MAKKSTAEELLKRVAKEGHWAGKMYSSVFILPESLVDDIKDYFKKEPSINDGLEDQG